MKVKTFYALTMQDALRSIKEELGPDAIILSSKEVREGDRLLQVRNRPVLEVMAACEQDSSGTAQIRREETPKSEADHPVAQPDVESPMPRNFQKTLQSVLKSGVVPARISPPITEDRSTQPARPAWRKNRLRDLNVELRELSRLLGESLPPETQSMRARFPSAVARLCRSFIRQGMRPSTAESLGRDLQRGWGKKMPVDEGTIMQSLQREIGRRVRVGDGGLIPTRTRAVSLVLGPSGSGKTSMVTKLAAHYRREHQRSVAVVTFDVCREVSVEHLRKYARALGVPFASARSPRQLHEGLRRYSRANLVLIDMPGVGPDEVASAKELYRLLHKESDMTTHVVLQASARERDLRAILDRVKDLSSLRILFTKLDETESFGTIFDLAQQTGMPLSYWGVGPRVPEDIETATPERLAEFLMAQRYVAFRGGARDGPVIVGSTSVPETVGSRSD
ncbi:MAG: hypothetical protein OEY86_04410 [Nitrospira sp.]|nr:hypothetical protein [Nitrospira sp.]